MKKILFTGLLIIAGTALFAQDHSDNKDNNRNRRDQRNQNDQSQRDQRNQQNQRDHQGRYQAPTTVQQAWQRDHPNVTNPSWEQHNGQWHARYQDQQYNNRYADTYYDQRGRQVDTHIPWDRSQVPQDLDRRVRSRYHARDYQVTRIERSNNQGSLFQILLNLGNNRNRTIYTDEHGNPVRYNDRH